jgi:hypothetical protein
MKAKLILLGLLMAVGLIAFLAQESNAQTQAAFYGYVYYKDCDCHPDHEVWIRKDGEPGDYHRIKCSGIRPGYSSEPYYYTAGWYYLSVVDLQGTGCDVSFVQHVYYSGVGHMQVDLQVRGPAGDPTGPPPGP